MPRVLAIEPNSERASTLRNTLESHVSDVLVVDSRGAAVEALEQEVPDLVLVSALLSPVDEDAVFDCLRSLPDSGHVQTLTIPQFRTAPEPGQKSKFSFFRRGQEKAVEGWDPNVFARDVCAYLERAAKIKAEFGTSSAPSMASDTSGADSEPAVEPEDTTDRSSKLETSNLTASLWSDDTPPTEVESVSTPTGDDVVTELFQPPRDSEDNEDAGASSPEMETRLAEELAKARAEAEERRLADVAEIRREAEVARVAEVRKTREVAEAEAAEALARVRQEAERQVADELAAAQAAAEKRQPKSGSTWTSPEYATRPSAPMQPS